MNWNWYLLFPPGVGSKSRGSKERVWSSDERVQGERRRLLGQLKKVLKISTTFSCASLWMDSSFTHHHIVQNMILALSNWLLLTVFPTFNSWRERKKKGGKNEEKSTRKSGGGKEKEKERATGNDSFKSREFISSEESSSETDKGKGRKRKVTH